MVEGATGMSSAVQDQVTQGQRVPIFNAMPDIVTGKVEVVDAVAQFIDLISTGQEEE